MPFQLTLKVTEYPTHSCMQCLQRDQGSVIELAILFRCVHFVNVSMNCALKLLSSSFKIYCVFIVIYKTEILRSRAMKKLSTIQEFLCVLIRGLTSYVAIVLK